MDTRVPAHALLAALFLGLAACSDPLASAVPNMTCDPQFERCGPQKPDAPQPLDDPLAPTAGSDDLSMGSTQSSNSDMATMIDLAPSDLATTPTTTAAECLPLDSDPYGELCCGGHIISASSRNNCGGCGINCGASNKACCDVAGKWQCRSICD